jgi:hypothetical protein
MHMKNKDLYIAALFAGRLGRRARRGGPHVTIGSMRWPGEPGGASVMDPTCPAAELDRVERRFGPPTARVGPADGHRAPTVTAARRPRIASPGLATPPNRAARTEASPNRDESRQARLALPPVGACQPLTRFATIARSHYEVRYADGPTISKFWIACWSTSGWRRLAPSIHPRSRPACASVPASTDMSLDRGPRPVPFVPT